MTSSSGNIFRVTGRLCGEFTGHRWIPRTPRPNKQLSKQSWGWWFETPLRSLWRHCNARKIWLWHNVPDVLKSEHYFKTLPVGAPASMPFGSALAPEYISSVLLSTQTIYPAFRMSRRHLYNPSTCIYQRYVHWWSFLSVYYQFYVIDLFDSLIHAMVLTQHQ